MSEKINPCCIVSFKDRNSRAIRKFCECKSVEADEDTELCECVHCGRFWTAFNWLMHITQKKRFLDLSTKDLTEKVLTLDKERISLKREIAYLKKRKERGER